MVVFEDFIEALLYIVFIISAEEIKFKVCNVQRKWYGKLTEDNIFSLGSIGAANNKKSIPSSCCSKF